MHKLTERDILFCEQLLRDSYSNDVLLPIFLSTLHEEELNPSFDHPSNWSELSDLEKAHLLVKTYFLKLLAITDFLDFLFKEVQSLFTHIETFLNQDVRLECNKLKPQ